MDFNKLLTAIGATGLGLTMATSALAVPSLQLFIEAADYEDAAENTSDPEDADTWAKLGTSSFRLWVVGDITVGNPNIQNRIRDVTFVASYHEDLSPSLAFTPSQTSILLSGFADPSLPSAPAGPTAAVAPGTYIPPLTNHSPYGAPNRLAVTWNLGNFDLMDSPLGNTEPPFDVEAIDNWFPTPLSALGQINVYDVLVSGLPVGAQVHFDVFGVLQELVTTQGACLTPHTPHGGQPHGHPNNATCLEFGPDITTWVDVYNGPNLNYVSSANSHDARWEQIGQDIPQVPEPASLSLLGAGLLGLAYFGKRKAAA